MWPGMTPAAVWDLPFRDWVAFAEVADRWVAEHNKSKG